MKDINQPVPESDIFENVQESVDFANSIGYPVIVRPAYTLAVRAAVLLTMKMNCS